MEELENAVDFVSAIIYKLIARNNIKEALDILDHNFANVSQQISLSVVMNRNRLDALQKDMIMGTITYGTAAAEQRTISLNVLNILSLISQQLDNLTLTGNTSPCLYKTTSEKNLQKIMGNVNHLVKINWLQKGIHASRSVCQVVRADGKKGTGFVLRDGYLMTNFHVLPTREKVATSKIVFDFEEDFLGNSLRTSEFFLEPDDMSCSPIQEFDYTYVKIRENPENPLAQWGCLELDTFSEPQVNAPVTIIQHPLGESKQIALTANKIIGINAHRLLYQTDTEKGSSGSPVFSNEWKVIALHHAGRTEEDGGLVVNPVTGERRGANEGILIKSIVSHENRIV